MKTFRYEIIMPTYGITHLYNSPNFTLSGIIVVVKTTTPRDIAMFPLNSLIPDSLLGYFLQYFLMSWPFSSPTPHQWLGALWQGFPIYAVLF